MKTKQSYELNEPIYVHALRKSVESGPCSGPRISFVNHLIMLCFLFLCPKQHLYDKGWVRGRARLTAIAVLIFVQHVIACTAKDTLK